MSVCLSVVCPHFWFWFERSEKERAQREGERSEPARTRAKRAQKERAQREDERSEKASEASCSSAARTRAKRAQKERAQREGERSEKASEASSRSFQLQPAALILCGASCRCRTSLSPQLAADGGDHVTARRRPRRGRMSRPPTSPRPPLQDASNEPPHARVRRACVEFHGIRHYQFIQSQTSHHPDAVGRAGFDMTPRRPPTSA